MKEFDVVKPAGRVPSEDEVNSAARKQLGLSAKAQPRCVLLKRSIDARGEVIYRYHYAAYAPGEPYEP